MNHDSEFGTTSNNTDHFSNSLERVVFVTNTILEFFYADANTLSGYFQTWMRYPCMNKSRSRYHTPMLRILIRGPGSKTIFTLEDGSWIRNRYFLVLGSQIPNPYFVEIITKFICEKA
jgi:hypothetical protein